MTTRTASRFALGAWMTSMLLMGLALALPRVADRWGLAVAMYENWHASIVIIATFATVGMLIATRRPTHRIGWLFTGIGLLSAMQFLAGQYFKASLAVGVDRLPGSVVAAWVSNEAQILTVTSVFFLILLFPTGHLPSPRWRMVGWVLALAIGLQAVKTAITAGPLESLPEVENPFGIVAFARALDLLTVLQIPLFCFGIGGTLVALLHRFRYARGLERQQLKWFVFAATVGVTILIGSTILLPNLIEGALGILLWSAVPGSIAIAAAVAILRYHLYDIDVIINRTLVYGLLTAMLGLIYIGCVVLLRQVLSPLTGSSELAIVASTLAIAALFSPLRRRIQTTIDKRFYRRKYDAAKVLAAFGATARDETDLDALTGELMRVIDTTVQPETVGLWLRKPEREVRR